MIISPELTAVLLGLTAAAFWGAGDFSGGIATRRTNVFGVVIVSQLIGLVMMIVLALMRAEPIPPLESLIWGGVAGISGVVGVVALYRALAVGQMGIAAPVSAVFTATVPVLVGAVSDGIPSKFQLVGFVLALIGIWFIAGHQGVTGRAQGLGLAILAGLGFGGLLVLLKHAGTTAVFWPLAAARAASISALIIFMTTSRQAWQPDKTFLRVIVLAGVFDVLGNVFYVMATQWGRMDVSAVLSSLYPASTVILAWFILKERLTRVQWLGIMAALLAIALITAGPSIRTMLTGLVGS